MTDTKDTNDFVSATPTEIDPAADSNSLSPFRAGTAGNVNGDRPSSWITSEQDCQERTALFNKGKS